MDDSSDPDPVDLLGIRRMRAVSRMRPIYPRQHAGLLDLADFMNPLIDSDHSPRSSVAQRVCAHDSADPIWGDLANRATQTCKKPNLSTMTHVGR